MDNENHFEDSLESIPDYRKIVFLVFLIKNDKDLLKEVGFNKTDIYQLSLEFKNILIEQHEKYLEYVKNKEESIFEKISKNIWKMIIII